MKATRKLLLALLVVALLVTGLVLAASAEETNMAKVTVGTGDDAVTTEYATFEAALKAALDQEGATITLLKNTGWVFDSSSTYPADPTQDYWIRARITLDLNGYTISCRRGGGIFWIAVGGGLTVKSSRTGGKIAISNQNATLKGTHQWNAETSAYDEVDAAEVAEADRPYFRVEGTADNRIAIDASGRNNVAFKVTEGDLTFICTDIVDKANDERSDYTVEFQGASGQLTMTDSTMTVTGAKTAAAVYFNTTEGTLTMTDSSIIVGQLDNADVPKSKAVLFAAGTETGYHQATVTMTRSTVGGKVANAFYINKYVNVTLTANDSVIESRQTWDDYAAASNASYKGNLFHFEDAVTGSVSLTDTDVIYSWRGFCSAGSSISPIEVTLTRCEVTCGLTGTDCNIGRWMNLNFIDCSFDLRARERAVGTKSLSVGPQEVYGTYYGVSQGGTVSYTGSAYFRSTHLLTANLPSITDACWWATGESDYPYIYAAAATVAGMYPDALCLSGVKTPTYVFAQPIGTTGTANKASSLKMFWERDATGNVALHYYNPDKVETTQDSYHDFAFYWNKSTSNVNATYGYLTVDVDIATSGEWLVGAGLSIQARNTAGSPDGTGIYLRVLQDDDGYYLQRQQNGQSYETVRLPSTANAWTHITWVMRLDLGAETSWEVKDENNVVTATPTDNKIAATSQMMIYVNGAPLTAEPITGFVASTAQYIDAMRVTMSSGSTVNETADMWIDNAALNAYPRTNTEIAAVFDTLMTAGADGSYPALTEKNYPALRALLPAQAEVDGVTYSTLKDAVAAAAKTESKTVTLLRDVLVNTDITTAGIRIARAGYAYAPSAGSNPVTYDSEDDIYTFVENQEPFSVYWYVAGEDVDVCYEGDAKFGGVLSIPANQLYPSTYYTCADGVYKKHTLTGWIVSGTEITVIPGETLVDLDIYEEVADGELYVEACYDVEDVTGTSDVCYVIEQQTAYGTTTILSMGDVSAMTTSFSNMQTGQTLRLTQDVTMVTGLKVPEGRELAIDLAGHKLLRNVKGSVVNITNATLHVYSSRAGGVIECRSYTEGDNGYNWAAGTFGLNGGNATLTLGKYGEYAGDNLTAYVGILLEVSMNDGGTAQVTIDGGNYSHIVTDSKGMMILRRCAEGSSLTVKNATIHDSTSGALLGFSKNTNRYEEQCYANVLIEDCAYYCTNLHALINEYHGNATVTLRNLTGYYRLSTSNPMLEDFSKITVGEGCVFTTWDGRAYSLAEGVSLAEWNRAIETHTATYPALNPSSAAVTTTWGADKVNGFKATADTVTVTYTDLAGATQTATLARGGNFVGTLSSYTVGILTKTFKSWSGTTENIQADTTLTPVCTCALTGLKQNLSLYSSFRVNLYVPKLADDVVVSIGGTVVSELPTTVIDGVTYYVATREQNAADAAEDAAFTLVLSDNGTERTAVVTLSTVAYAEKILTDTSERFGDDDRTFILYMLNYVKAAMSYFQPGNTEAIDTVTALLSTHAGELMNRTYTDPAEDISSSGYPTIFHDARLALEDAPAFRFDFNAEGGKPAFNGTVRFTYVDYAGVTRTVDMAVSDTDTGVYLRGMKAYDFDALITVSYCKDGETEFTECGQYKLAAYAPSTGVTEELTNLVDALKLYVQESRTYKKYLKTQSEQ